MDCLLVPAKDGFGDSGSEILGGGEIGFAWGLVGGCVIALGSETQVVAVTIIRAVVLDAQGYPDHFLLSGKGSQVVKSDVFVTGVGERVGKSGRDFVLPCSGEPSFA